MFIYHVVEYDHDVRDRVSVGVREVVVGSPVEDEPVALLLTKDGREAQGVLAPGNVTLGKVSYFLKK